MILLDRGLPSDQQHLMAAQLFAGPEAWLAGHSALAAHDAFGVPVRKPIEVLVPPSRRARQVQWVTVRATVLTGELFDSQGQRLTSPDVWFDDVALAVMVHSRRFHGAELDWVSTVEADSDLTAAGVMVLGVTPTTIVRTPTTVLARIEAAWQTARSRHWRPQIRAVHRQIPA